MKVDSILWNGILCRKKVVHASIKRILLSVQFWDYERTFHHELLLFDHRTINKKYYTRLDQLKTSFIFRKKESLMTKDYHQQFCKFWKDISSNIIDSLRLNNDKTWQKFSGIRESGWLIRKIRNEYIILHDTK